MAKNYYLILGVGTDATQDQIKTAYRQQAKRFHPDRYPGGCEFFLAVQEAYEALRDPVRRLAHDSRLAREQWGEKQADLRKEQPVDWTVPPCVERTPSLREVFDRLWLDLDLTRPLAERVEDIRIDIALTREQAVRGGRVRVSIPAQAACPTCRGRGRIEGYECWQCLGTGLCHTERPLAIAFPPGIVDGSSTEIFLDSSGRSHVCLVVCFQVLDS